MIFFVDDPPVNQLLQYLSKAMEKPPRVNSARASLQKSEQLVRQGGDLDELPRVLLAIAQLRLFEDDADRALKEVRQAHWLSERTGQNLRIVDSLIARGQIELRRGYRRKATGLSKMLATWLSRWATSVGSWPLIMSSFRYKSGKHATGIVAFMRK